MTQNSNSNNSLNARLLELRGITKSFPGVRALRGIDLHLEQGEVVGLLGENGAGKSTLIKILAGVHLPDEGEVLVRGLPTRWSTPIAAQRAGIAVIHQEFNLVPTLSARENIFLGREEHKVGWLNTRRERSWTEELFRRLGVVIDPETWCRNLTVAQQQLVEIAKALAINSTVIVMDEPSATLSPREVTHLLNIVRELRSQGMGIIYVSHRLDEIFEIADRVTVLRDGAHVDTRPIKELSRSKVIELMVGRKLEDEFPKRPIREPSGIGQGAANKSSDPVPGLVIHNLCRGKVVRDVSFQVRRGEIVALTGLVGAGRTEVARLIFGADRRDRGTIQVDGKTVNIHNPRDAIAHGICFLTEDRKSQGLILRHSALENFGLPNMRRFAPRGWIARRAERTAFDNHVTQLRIKLTGPSQLVGTLSGGNQQKIVLAKWLERNADIIIFDEPTRGIDVGAKFEIYTLMNQLVAANKAVLMISSELPEVLGMADRILVMHEGRITGEIDQVSTATQADILELAVR